MPTPYPYTPSAGPIVTTIQQLRRSFPANVDASTLKKLAIASGNESFVIGVLRFIGVLDQEGNKIDKANKVFLNHDESAFQNAFAELVKDAYKELFSLHGDAAWNLDQNNLITFFRQSSESSQLVGQRQANTFKTLSALSGHTNGQPSKPKPAKVPERRAKQPKDLTPIKQNSAASQGATNGGQGVHMNPFGLTVRVEVNLPASADQETYDRIFQSIRKNLINRSEL